MYSIDFISLESFSILEHDWDLLQRGKDMTYFQQYVWYKILAELNKEIKNKNIEYCFARVKKEGKTNLIAPLWIVKNTFAKFNKKGVYIFGRAQWSDYLNFIYDEFDSASLDFLFNHRKHLNIFFYSKVSITLNIKVLNQQPLLHDCSIL